MTEIMKLDKINILVYLFEDIKTNATGGNLCLHKLAYELARRNFNVVIFAAPQILHENLHVIESERIDSLHFKWQSFSFPINNTISIYPENVYGNPFNTQKVVRWILGKPTIDAENDYGTHDAIFSYPSHSTNYRAAKSELFVFNKIDETFTDENLSRRGYCFINHKKTPEKYLEVMSKYSAKDLTYLRIDKNFKKLKDEFNTHKYFLTYDDKTYYSVIAALCGCIPIVIPQDEKSPIEFRKENFLQSLGVAYGFDDIDWAIKTNHLVKDLVLSLEELTTKSVKDFSDFLKKW